jgi:hypothetical protein
MALGLVALPGAPEHPSDSREHQERDDHGRHGDRPKRDGPAVDAVAVAGVGEQQKHVHRLKRTLVAALLLALAGCGGGDGAHPSDEEVIRGWVTAVSRGDYERAAAYFAPGAIVEQLEVVRLPDRAAAIEFNRSLPCRADLTDVDDEGATTLAAFRLREGRDGRCGPGEGAGESARVRFLIRDGRILEWRQLPEAPVPEGDVV